MNSSCKTTRLYIPHAHDSECKIAGDLEQVDPQVPTQGRKIILILHGTMGHKDYLYQKRLAKALPVDSFRFDFRGAHETGGTWKMSAFDEDIEDLEVVVNYLTKEYGYVIDTVVSHSRASIVTFRWICTTESGRKIRAFRILERSDFYNSYFKAHGYYDWKVVVAQKQVVGRIYPEDLEKFATWDTTPFKENFPPGVHVLTIHGMQDKVVPVYDAILFSRLLGRRDTATHNLCLLEEADHNFTLHKDEVVSTILAWWSVLNRDGLKTGIWDDEIIKGRL
ncbi:ectomycorrhiza-regulated esterase [Pyrrhoderma noxium]|uniref:Ectomycorrhiza-regulated esterase n=1 Tax=Pyrrhoderma noxium TaxID=2282107 RepID=A0A286UBJ7_9AGAM|nr:ectomycorrhiza-regulated esterase [Pyrrhoderma noxium]